MSDVRALLLEPTPRAARAVALGLLDVLDGEHARLGKARDAEALHDFRVALRRLRSWLRAYRRDVRDSIGKKSMNALGSLASATTASRDIEVHLLWLKLQMKGSGAAARGGIRWLSRKFAAEKKRADAEARAMLDAQYAALSAKFRKQLSRYAVAVWDQAQDDRWAGAAATHVQDAFLALRRRLTLIEDAADDAQMHRARIAGKRLRYLTEPLVGAVDGAPEVVELLKRMQDLLGDKHDSHVFGKAIRRHARAHGAHGVQGAGGRTDHRAALRSLARRLDTRGEVAWKAFREEWLEQGFPALSAQVHLIVQRLREMGGEGLEIERKFLLRSLPVEARTAPAVEIEQGYLPGTKLIERLRRAKTPDGARYTRTVKSGEGLVRTELEEACSHAVFKSMWPLTKDRRVVKRRYRVADAGQVWEIDEFLDRKLVLAEIELSSATEAVVVPEWLARCVVREVTDESEYVNANLAR